MRNTELIKRLEDFWPEADIFVFDPLLADVSWGEAQEVIRGWSIDLPPEADCDDYALQLYAWVKKMYPLWPIGRVMGPRINGSFFSHAVNIFVPDTGIMLIEPQGLQFWRANPGRDVLYFIEV